MLHGMGQEICINQNGVGRDEGSVVLEKEGGGDLGSVSYSLRRISLGRVFVELGGKGRTFPGQLHRLWWPSSCSR